MQNSLLNKIEWQDLCEKYHVTRLEVFGSAVRDDFDPKHSDLDFLVKIDPVANSSYFDDYFGLREALESSFNRPVDLLSIDALDNPYFIERIASERKVLYAA